MEKITHDQLQRLIERLPDSSLPIAFALLQDLVTEQSVSEWPQAQLLRLPIERRYAVLEAQAEYMMEHYTATSDEREAWQGGDFDQD